MGNSLSINTCFAGSATSLHRHHELDGMENISQNCPVSPVNFDQTLNAWVSRAAPDENRMEASKIIKTCFDAQNIGSDSVDARTLSLYNFGLKDLPDVFDNLKKLEELNLSNNQLTSLPNSFGCLIKLEILNISYNKLTSLPDSFGCLIQLKTLYLFWNELTSLPDSFGCLIELKILNISYNQLRNLPESLGNLTNANRLMFTYFNYNRLTTLPQSIVDFSRSTLIDISNNPLPLAVIHQLNQAIMERHAQDPTRGPQILHSMQPGPAITTLSLLDEIKSWRQASQLAMHPAEATQWNEAIAKLDKNSVGALSSALSNQLGRLRQTAYYRLANEEMNRRVNIMLDSLQHDPEALQACAAQAIEGTETCDDRIALAFIVMEESLIERRAYGPPNGPPLPLGTLKTIAIGLYKSKFLQKIANQKADGIVGFVDRTEIILKYFVKLSRTLNLPCPIENMIFHECAHAVSDGDIESARLAIETAQADTKKFNRHLAGWEPWLRALAHYKNPEYELAACQVKEGEKKLREELEDLCANLDKIKPEQGNPSTAYLVLAAEIGTYRNRMEENKIAPFFELTQQIP